MSLERLKDLGITHVLSVCPDYPPATGVTDHLAIPVQDSEYEDLLIHLPKACAFIQKALDQNGKILVHCVMGVSRSSTVVCAWRESIISCRTPLLITIRSNVDSKNIGYPSCGVREEA